MRTALVLGLAVLVLSGAGCRVRCLGNESYDLVPITEPRPTLPPIPPQEAAPTATVAAPIVPNTPWSKTDETVTTIWKKDENPEHRGHHPPVHDLIINQVDLTESSILLHLQHKVNKMFESEFAGTSQTPTVTMLLNSCPVDPPAVFGTVTWNGRKDEIVAVQRERLPKGDLSIDCSVFDRTRTMMFMNYDSGFSVMTDISQSKWYETDPAPTGSGEMAGATLNYPKNCGVE
jgi:hypothetical protein